MLNVKLKEKEKRTLSIKSRKISTTADQYIFVSDDNLKALIDVEITKECDPAPSIQECRHAVLPINNDGKGFVVYDRFLCRIVNGVFLQLEDALLVARSYNEDLQSTQHMNPNGFALGLKYPETQNENAPKTILIHSKPPKY